MRGLFGLAAAAATLVSQTAAAPLQPLYAAPHDQGTLVITHDNTLNSTTVGAESVSIQEVNPLKISLVNKFAGDQLYAWIDGKDSTGAIVMLKPDGTWYYPDPAGSTTPVELPDETKITLNGQGQSTEITIPEDIVSGRIWIAEGSLTFYTVADANGAATLVQPSAANPDDPSHNVNWGFVELTNTKKGGLYANISFVDFVGLILGMKLTLGTNETQEVIGLTSTSVADICNGLTEQAGKDGQPWDQLCVPGDDGTPLRIMAPNMYIANNPSAMETYYDAYIEEVWTKYSSADLKIDTQTGAGTVACRTSGNQLSCDGDNRAYPKPTVADIWGCNTGPFGILEGDNDVHKAIVPRLCAAFHRTTLLMDGGDTQPGLGSESYYTVDPTSHYSRLVHEHQTDGKGYAFSYDDVNPANENAAGVVSGANPQLLEVVIGGST